MTDYNKLVKALRSASTVSTAFGKLMADAADAIEALQAEIRESMQRCAECGDELAHQMPKRGEWVDGDNFEDPFLGKFRCSVCGHAVQAIEYNYEQKTVRFASGKTKYCPNCGAKMEVQE